MPNPEQLGSFVEWYQRCITGDEKGQAQIFLDRLFQGFGLKGSFDVGGPPEFFDPGLTVYVRPDALYFWSQVKSPL